MAIRWYYPRYYGSRYGTLCCIKVTKPANTYIKNFNTYAGQLQLPYKQSGNLINSGVAPRILRGAVWYHYPTRGNDAPESLSKNEYNMKDYFKAPNSYPKTLTEASWSPKLEFEFEVPDADLSGTTCYCGFYSDYTLSTATSNFCHPVDTSVTEIYNQEGVISESAEHGLIIQANSLNPVPPIEAPSILITDWSPIVKYDTNNGFISWNTVSNQNSTTSQEVNSTAASGSKNTGDGGGTLNIKPSDYNVGTGSNYTVKAIRKNSLNTASDQITLYTYTTPTVSNLVITAPESTKSDSIINANHDLSLSWTSNSPVNDGKSTQPTNKGANAKTASDKHKTVLTVKGTTTSEMNQTSSGITVPTSTIITSTNLMKYVPFDKSKTVGETVTIKLTKSHANDSNISSSSVEKNITVRYIPVEAPIWPAAPETGYKIKDSSGKYNTILAKNAAVDKTEVTHIQVNFSYNSGELGIIDGYEIIIKASDGTTNTYDIPTTRSNPNLKPSTTIPTEELRTGLTNEAIIRAYYKHTENNQTTKYYGPEAKQQFPSIITRLSKPTITYPADQSTWINQNYRILLYLPNDPDYNSYDEDRKNSYKYRDMQVKIVGSKKGVVGGSSITKTYSWSASNNKHNEIFSLENLLGHKSQIAINPSLMSDYPTKLSDGTTINQYKISVRVRKNYGYSDSQEEASWSKWSDERTIYVETASFSVNQGDLILASHYNSLKNLVDRMRTTYPSYKVTTIEVKRGDYIMADGDIGFKRPYNDIISCYDTVNKWGTYSTNRESVKFNSGEAIPSFTPTKGEYITDLAEDKNPIGRNYITLLFNYANLLK